MIDYHCHLLPGLDDGPRAVEQSLAMARTLVAFGFDEVCCTPHCIKGHYQFSPSEVRDAVHKLQGVVTGAGIPLQLHAGMEYYLDACFETFASNLLPLGGSRLVLCEAPPQIRAEVVLAMLKLIVAQGYVPLLAHPERSEVALRLLAQRHVKKANAASPASVPPEVSPVPDRTTRWFGSSRKPGTIRGIETPFQAFPPELPPSCLFQANLGSFTGYYGDQPQRRAYELLQRGAYACFASDLHDEASATMVLEPAREKLELNPTLRKLQDFVAPPGPGGSAQPAFW